MEKRSMNEIEFRIVKRIGVICSYPTGWNKELNIVSWNGGTAKYDIRDWNMEHDKMSRGITLYEEEAAILGKMLYERFAKQGYYATSTSDSTTESK